MSLLKTFVQHPRKLWLRRALFQIHLWSGVLLTLYVVMIALTGSILVFRAELRRVLLPGALSAYNGSHVASLGLVLESFRTQYPGAALEDVQMPSPGSPAFLLTASDASHMRLNLVADPQNGRILPQPKTWLDWVYELHVYLLLGHAYGVQVNGLGAAGLLLLAATGMILWWSGIRTWTRGLRIDLRRNWRRINFDTHNAIGFWILLIICWWAVSGVYFAWYRQVSAVAAIVSPVRGMQAPKLPALVLPGLRRASLEQMLDAIHQASPDGRLFSLSDPTLSGPTCYALMDLRAPGDFSHRDLITLSTADAHVLTVWHYGQNQTASDWFLWAMHPLHFGNRWGTPVEILWALAGVALAVLSVTGLLMYWNRFLRQWLLR